MTTKRMPAPVTADPQNHATAAVAAETHQRATTPLEHAVELRTLRMAAAQTSNLTVALKQQRRKSRLVETTLATLRELKTAEAA